MSQEFAPSPDNERVSPPLYDKSANCPSMPAGLEFLYNACRQLYPSQPNPLQVTAVLKYWLGGPDPLDYISMYYNAGSRTRQIPPHWHYVSFGLSDLHGDGRVHEVSDSNLTSGLGFELTMRVRCEVGEKTPPTWPAALMQSLAKYVFQTDSIFCSGDHISWHSALDNSESRIQHMLISEDPQLGIQHTPFGRVQFLQVVGLTVEELQAAQRWNGSGVLNIMQRFQECGGCWNILDMRRGENIFDMDPSVSEEIENGIEKEGSNLSGVSAKVSWSLLDDESTRRLEALHFNQEHEYCELVQRKHEEDFVSNRIMKQPYNMQELSYNPENFSNKNSPEKLDVCQVQLLPSLHLTLNLESGLLLPLMLRGRLKHGRHFTFKSSQGFSALTFLTPSVEGGFVTSDNPYGVQGPWLQILVDEELLDEMSKKLTSLMNPQNIIVPTSFEFLSKRLKITIIGNEV